MLKRRRGSLTVEAVLILPIFMAAILFISYFVKAHIVQDVVQDALTEAVMEVSSLSYPYYLSGALEFKEAVHEETAGRMDALRENYGTIAGLLEQVHGEPGLRADTGELTPESMFRLAKLTAADQGINAAEDTIARELILGTMGRVLSADGKSIVERMEVLGIENGLDGFDFTGSVFYGEQDEMDIQVRYTLNRVDPFGFVRNVPMKNRVVCRAWMGGVDIDADGSYKRVTVPPKAIVKAEDPEKDADRVYRTCYILPDSQTSTKYHFHDCPNLRVRGDPDQMKTVVPIQVLFVRTGEKWQPEGSVDYQGKVYDLCGSCQAGIIRMKD